MARPEQQKPPRAGGPAGGFSVNQKGHADYIDIRACLEDFRAFILAEYGLDLMGQLNADGEFHGIGTGQDKHGAKPFRYCVHLDDPQNIFFQDMKRGFSGAWFPEGHAPLDLAERERRRRESEARKAGRERQTAERRAKAAGRALYLWRRAAPASPRHPYLVRKGVGVHGLRRLAFWERRVYGEDGYLEAVKIPNVLLVPMKDAGGTLWNVQAIFAETCPALGRDKDFLPGGRKKGLCHWIGRRTETVCLAEGYATGATIHEATGYRVFVAFDAGNLPVVAEAVRGALPDARIVVCADNDKPDPQGRQAGQENAHRAAALVGGFVALPPVEGQDFNDWAAALGGVR